MNDLMKIKQGTEAIIKKRAEISKLIVEKSANIKDGTIKAISNMDLKLIFDLYDTYI